MVVVVHHSVGFRTGTGVLLDGLNQVLRAPIVQEKDSLPQSPQRSGAKFVRPGAALNNVVRQSRTHVVNGEVGKEIRILVAQAIAEDRHGSLHARRMAKRTAETGEKATPGLHVLRASRA